MPSPCPAVGTRGGERLPRRGSGSPAAPFRVDRGPL